MSALNGGMNFYGQMPDSYTVAVNYEHPLVQKISSELADKVSPELSKIDAQKETPKKQLEELKEKTKSLKYDEITVEQRDEMDKLEKEIEKIDNEKREKITNFSKNNDLLRQVCDLALLSNNMLKGEELSRFIKRSISMIG
jgi:molecular chaperone HtpG